VTALSIVAGVVFAALLLYGAPAAEHRGLLKVYDYCSVSLERGEVVCIVILDGDGTEPKQHPGGKDFDFWFEASGKVRSLHPQNRTMFANAGTTQAGRAGCQAGAYKSGGLRIDTLPLGSHLCVLTGHGRYAELTLESTANSPDEPLQVIYILWR
jgi:hypothetical protein